MKTNLSEKTTRKPCTICRRWNGTVLSERDGNAVIRCNSCGLYYVDTCPRPDIKMPAAENNSAEIGQRYLHEVYQEKSENWMRFFGAKLKMIEGDTPGKRLLDVGCGVGYLVRAALDQGWDAIGIDTGSDEIAFGVELLDLGDRLQSGLFEQANYSQRFDVITLFSVIEHVQDPYQFFIDVHDLLNPGGIVVVKTPSQDSLITLLHWALFKLSRGKRDTGLYNEEHIYRFSKKTLSMLAEKTGFKVKRLGYDDQVWITATRFLFNKRHRLVGYLALSLVTLAGKVLRRQNQLLVILQKPDQTDNLAAL